MLVSLSDVVRAMIGHISREDLEDIIDEIVKTHHNNMVADYALKSLRLTEQAKQSVMQLLK